MRSGDLHTYGLAGLLLALATLTVIGDLSLRTSQGLQQAFREADGVHRVLSLNQNVLNTLRDAESEQRGYLLTGREDYLEPYQKAVRHLPEEMTQLTVALGGETDQLRRASLLEQLLDERLHEMQRTIGIRRAGGLTSAMVVMSIDRSKLTMDRVQQVSRDLENHESAKLAADLAARHRRVRRMRFLILVGYGLLTLLVGGAYLAIRTGEAHRERLAALVESSDDAIIGKSTDGIVQSWNAGAERLYGYRAEEMIGRRLSDLIPPDRRHEESDIYDRLQRGGHVEHLETVRVRKGGHPVDISLTISPIRNRAGRIVGISHVAQDITARKKDAEKMRQAQKWESLGILAGGVAHDFNNLLTAIIGNASLAADEVGPNAPARAQMQNIIQAGERATRLTSQMLAYSGRSRFRTEPVDLSARIREILPLIQSAVPSNIDVRFDLDDNLPVIEGDPDQFQQLIMNIILNGAEAIPAGKPGTVTVTTRRQDVDESYTQASDDSCIGELRPGTYVLFAVSDTGCGMDDAVKVRIFDPFFTTKFTGRGLGLAAVLGIVRGHHGCIWVASTPGQGTTFRVLFPAVEKTVEPKASERQPESGLPAGSGTVLFIDDEQMVRDAARQALESYGFSVLTAENGERGLALLSREAGRIRCVVLDLTMPVMSGEETLSRLEALGIHVPVILSSGYSEGEAMRRFKGRGVAAFLQKPYTPAALAAKISTVVAQPASD